MTRWDRDAEIDRLHHLASCRVDFIGGDIPWTERPWVVAGFDEKWPVLQRSWR